MNIDSRAAFLSGITASTTGVTTFIIDDDVRTLADVTTGAPDTSRVPTNRRHVHALGLERRELRTPSARPDEPGSAQPPLILAGKQGENGWDVCGARNDAGYLSCGELLKVLVTKKAQVRTPVQDLGDRLLSNVENNRGSSRSQVKIGGDIGHGLCS